MVLKKKSVYTKAHYLKAFNVTQRQRLFVENKLHISNSFFAFACF